jgi:transposase-like protein
MEELNLASLPKYLSDEAEAGALLERLRWPDDKPVCPHCGTKDAKHYFISARSGQRVTKAGNVTYRRIWRCRNKTCRKQFSVLVGTIFESSKLPVSKWLLALYLVAPAKNAISALELQRHLGIAYATAWFVLHRLREAMTREPLAGLLSGTVVADETFMGGKPKNRHQQGRPSRLPGGAKSKTGVPYDKTPVLALISKDTGQARAQVVTDVTGATLRKAMGTHVDVPNTVLHTDAAGAYKSISHEFAGHEYVEHRRHEYVRGDVTSNQAESFFAQFKRSLDGTYHNVSTCHLPRYVTEFEFRWNTRQVTDHKRIEALVAGAVGKRLTYRPLAD